MKLLTALLIAWLPLATPIAARAQTSQPQPRVVELKASDGTVLKATYFSSSHSAGNIRISKEFTMKRG